MVSCIESCFLFENLSNFNKKPILIIKSQPIKKKTEKEEATFLVDTEESVNIESIQGEEGMLGGNITTAFYLTNIIPSILKK